MGHKENNLQSCSHRKAAKEFVTGAADPKKSGKVRIANSSRPILQSLEEGDSHHPERAIVARTMK